MSRASLLKAYLVLSCGGGAAVGGLWGLRVGADDKATKNMTVPGKIMWKLIYIPLFTALGAGVGGVLGPLAPLVFLGDQLVKEKS